MPSAGEEPARIVQALDEITAEPRQGLRNLEGCLGRDQSLAAQSHQRRGAFQRCACQHSGAGRSWTHRNYLQLLHGVRKKTTNALWSGGSSYVSVVEFGPQVQARSIPDLRRKRRQENRNIISTRRQIYAKGPVQNPACGSRWRRSKAHSQSGLSPGAQAPARGE